MLLTKKVSFVMILVLIAFASLAMSFFFKQYFFPNQENFSTSFSFLPDFDHDSPLPIRVYERHKKDVSTLSPPQDLPPAPDPPTAAVQSPIPLRCSTCSSRPPDRYGFTHTSLVATVSSLAIPNSYSQAVKHDCWKKAMRMN